MPKTIYAATRNALAELDSFMSDLLDVAKIPDKSPLDLKVQAALNQLHEAMYDLPKMARDSSALDSRTLIYPVKGRDMREWFTSDQRPSRRRALCLLKGRRASRVASAARVVPPPEVHPMRVITAQQYLKLLDEAIYTDSSFDDEGADDSEAYEASRDFSHHNGGEPDPAFV